MDREHADWRTDLFKSLGWIKICLCSSQLPSQCRSNLMPSICVCSCLHHIRITQWFWRHERRLCPRCELQNHVRSVVIIQAWKNCNNNNETWGREILHCCEVHQVLLRAYENAESLSKMPRRPGNNRPMEIEKFWFCQTMPAFVMFRFDKCSHNILTPTLWLIRAILLNLLIRASLPPVQLGQWQKDVVADVKPATWGSPRKNVDVKVLNVHKCQFNLIKARKFISSSAPCICIWDVPVSRVQHARQ